MKFGAMNFPAAPLLEEIEAIARLGFDYLECAMDPPMAHHSSLSTSAPVITRALKDYGLGLVCHLPTFVSTADLTETIRRASTEEMLRSLETALRLGAEKTVLHPSMVSGMGAFALDQVKGYAYEFLARMEEDAKRLGVTICLENMFPRNILGVEPKDLEEMFSLFPAFKFTLDTGHANIGDWDGRRLIKLAELFAGRLEHLHFSDNQGKRDDHWGIGRGTVNFSELVTRLKESGYGGTLTLEVFGNDRQELAASLKHTRELFSG